MQNYDALCDQKLETVLLHIHLWVF